ncbi:MAG: tail fiber protein [Candidatus Eisenbacteria bacterium]
MRRCETPGPRVLQRSATFGLLAPLVVLAACAWVWTASASVPETMTFQGVLSVDEAPFSGSAHLVFSIYAQEAAGTPLWSQDAGEILITDGLYTATLGPLAGLAFDQDYWLEVSVDGAALTPRYPLHSVPYAWRAATAEALADGAADGAAVLDGSLTAADLGTDVVSSISGVANDGGDIELVAGAHITITPDDAANSITIAADIGAGDVTDVIGGAGLTAATPEGPQVTLAVGAGSGIEVTPDAVQLDAAYLSGSAYDTRFLNAGEANSITSAMIVPDLVSAIAGVSNDGGDITLAAGPNVTIAADDAANTITISAVDGEGGDVTDVAAGDGLIATTPEGPQVTLAVGAGDGIIVSEDAIAVNAGTGLTLSGGRVGLEAIYSSGEAYDERFINEDEPNSVTAGMLGTDVVASISGVVNDGGDIVLAAGPNVSILADDEEDTIWISATGDVTDVHAGPGIQVTDSGGPQVTVGVNAGHGLLATDDGLVVDVIELAGPGLRQDGENFFAVTPGTGLEIADDEVQLDEFYRSGSIYDDRFVNEGQEISVALDMISFDIISSVDGVVHDGGDIDLVAGDYIVITPDNENDRITIGTNTSGLDTRFVNEEGPGTIPVGGIVMWSGGSVPSGWALCNGQTVNGHTTPDLRDRFVVAAGGGYSIGSTGGESMHTLTTSEMPSHDHGVTDPGHAHFYTSPVYGNYQGLDYDGENGTAVEYPYENAAGTVSATTGISIQSSGEGAAHNNMPPYYALAFIMRVQ